MFYCSDCTHFFHVMTEIIHLTDERCDAESVSVICCLNVMCVMCKTVYQSLWIHWKNQERQADVILMNLLGDRLISLNTWEVSSQTGSSDVLLKWS